jgi:cytochrome c oxidase subunit 2
MHLFRNWLQRRYAKRIIWMTLVITAGWIAATFLAVYFMNMSGGPASSIMSEIELTMYVLAWVCAPLMGVTLAIALYSMIGGWGRVTGDKQPDQDGPGIRNNSIATIGWAVWVSALAAFLVVWGLVELANIQAFANGSVTANQQPNSQQSITINVTGQQWVWTFAYPDQNKVTTDVLVVPINTPIYFNVTSKDVVHSFWVVELGVKIDANPGAITNTGFTATKLGTFNIRCAELCGLHHAYMETQVKVVTQDQYNSWVRENGGVRLS